MITIKIAPNNIKGFLSIFVEDEFWKKIPTAVFGRKISFTKSYINIAEFEDDFHEIEKRAALNYALKILGQRDLPSAQIALKLEQKDISEKAVLHALDKINSYNYIDDGNWVRKYIQYELGKSHGPLLIKNKLLQKKISIDLIKEGLSKISEEELSCSIKKIIAKDKYKDRNKLIQALIRRGFQYENISRLID